MEEPIVEAWADCEGEGWEEDKCGKEKHFLGYLRLVIKRNVNHIIRRTLEGKEWTNIG
jgi:hypothetical protein